jgi:hypothetical protein
MVAWNSHFPTAKFSFDPPSKSSMLVHTVAEVVSTYSRFDQSSPVGQRSAPVRS